MKFILLATFVALATASRNTHLKNKRQLLEAPYSYGAPSNPFGVPQGSVQTLSYSGAGNIDHVAQPAASFSASFNSLPTANGAAFQQATFSSTAAPDVSALGFSTAAPFDSSSFQQYSFQSSTPAPVASDFQQSNFAGVVDSAQFASFQGSSTPSPIGYSGFQQSNFGGLNSGFDSSALNAAGFQASTPSPAAFSGFQQSNFGELSNVNSGFGASSLNAASFQASPVSGDSGFEQSGINPSVSQQIGGSLNEAFGVSSSAASSASSDAVEVGNGPVVEPKVIKNVYFYEAPEDEELVVSPKISYEQQQPTKSYKIIFVKAPSYKTNLPIEIPAPPAHEEKTLVYVLVKKPEAQAVVNVKAGQAPVQTKPEVFFIKYKTQQEAEEAVAKIQSQQGIHEAGNGFAGGNKASAVDVSTVLNGRAFPKGSTVEGAGFVSQSQANALTVGGVTEAAPVAVSAAHSEVSNEAVASHVEGDHVEIQAQSEIANTPISESVVGHFEPAHHIEQVVSVSSEAPAVGVYTLSPVTAGPQTFLTGTYNENQVGLLGSHDGLLQGKFGLTVNHSGSSGASGVAEIGVEGTPVSVEVSSPSAHTEGAVPEVISVNEEENNVDASADSSSHHEASAHAESNAEVGFQSYGPPAKRRGWYILKDWNYQDFDGQAVLKKLHVKYGVSPYFTVHVEPNSHLPGASSIRISPSGLGMPDREYYYRDEDDRIQIAYKEYIRDVVTYLSSPKTAATKFGQDIFSYEKRIAEITPDLVSLQSPITTYNAVTLAELQTSTLINFHEILQAMYPEGNITENTEVIVTSLEYLNQISQIVASTDKRTMNGYLIWTLVRSYVPYLSDAYTSALDSFKSELFGISHPPERWEQCSQLVRNHMGLAVELLLEQANPISNKTTEIVHETFNNILTVAKVRISKFQNSVLLYQLLNSKLESLSLQIGIPASTKSQNFVKEFFVPLQIIKSDLFESVKNSFLFRKRLEQNMLTDKLQENNILRRLFEEVPAVKYVEASNLVLVPRSLVEEPFFEKGFPSSLIYGRLGVEISQAIIFSILPYGSLWTSERKILSPFHSQIRESLKSVEGAKNCLADYILGLNLDVARGRATEIALRTLKELSAVKIAHEALLNQNSNKEHIHQPGLEEFEESALFFISYSQAQCSDSTSQYQLYQNVMNFVLPQRSVLHLAWAQIPEFQKAFNCRQDKKVQCKNIF